MCIQSNGINIASEVSSDEDASNMWRERVSYKSKSRRPATMTKHYNGRCPLHPEVSPINRLRDSAEWTRVLDEWAHFTMKPRVNVERISVESINKFLPFQSDKGNTACCTGLFLFLFDRVCELRLAIK